MNINQLKQLKKKLNSCKKDNSKPYFMTFNVENNIIKSITVSEEKGSSKIYTEASKSFDKWKAYILSDDVLKDHIEASMSFFCIIKHNEINIFTNEMEIEE